MISPLPYLPSNPVFSQPYKLEATGEVAILNLIGTRKFLKM